jgi:BclB C-terminal domain-containing protein
MKKFTLMLAVFVLAIATTFAQTPQLINYQAVVRNAGGDPVTNQNVALRFSIHNGSTSGTVVYEETQNLSTNALGLVNIQIGNGTPVSGTFGTVNWATGTKYLQVEADITGGSNYTSLANVQLVSVPYALNAKTSSDNRWDTTGTVDIVSNNTGNVGIGENPNAGAKLDIASTNKGVLIPRITLANRPASPANGLLIYQTDNTPGFYYYNGTAWTRVANTADIGNTGSIIPFSSGLPISMTTIAGGLSGSSSLLGFGNSVTGVNQTGGVIDLTGGQGTLLDFAFVCPRTGTLSSLSAQFSLTQAMTLIGTTITVTAQLYTSPAGSNSFTAVPGAVITLTPALTGVVAVGTTAYGTTTGLSIPMVSSNRYLLVYAATAAGLTLTNTINGYASAGVNIN